MKKSILAFSLITLSLSMIAASPSARAEGGEGITQIATNVKHKQALVKSLQERVARHKKMQLDEIVAEFSRATALNREALAKDATFDITAYDKRVALSLDQAKALSDKDVIIAVETAQIQQVMSSENIIYALTRHVFFGHSNGPGWFYPCQQNEAAGCAGMVLLTPFVGIVFLAIATVDTLALPFELLGSALTGF